MNKDYYEILGVSKDADQEAIKKAYRKMAMKYHPDVSTLPDAEARMKEVNVAYETLSDPQKRATYDRYGSDAQTFTQQTQNTQGTTYYGDMDELLRAFFEQMNQNRQQNSSRSYYYEVRPAKFISALFRAMLWLIVLQFLMSFFIRF